jgi:hypothetical protein
MNRIAITAIALTALGAATADAAAARKPVPARGAGDCLLLPPQDPAPLTDDEIAALLGMRQEEKLARDVYLALYRQWQHPVFRIHRAEQRHMDALAVLLTRYELDDPVVDDTPGVFADPVYAELYAELTADGAASLLDALQVGARIEEMDILDLREARAETTKADILWVYDNLERGSRNHLRAFAGRIDMLGGTYEAQHLTQDEFDAIARSPQEPGPGQPAGRGMGRGAGRGQGQGAGRGRGAGRGGRGRCGGW